MRALHAQDHSIPTRAVPRSLPLCSDNCRLCLQSNNLLNAVSGGKHSTRLCRGGRVTTFSQTSRLSLSSRISSDLQTATDLLPPPRRRCSLSSGLEQSKRAPVATASGLSTTSSPTLPSVHLRSKQLSDPNTSQSLQADVDAPGPAATVLMRQGLRGRQATAAAAVRPTRAAIAIHAARVRGHAAVECAQDSVSLPLDPSATNVRRCDAATSPPQPHAAPAWSDPFLDSNSVCVSRSTTSAHVPQHVSATDDSCASGAVYDVSGGYMGVPSGRSPRAPPAAADLTAGIPSSHVPPNSNAERGQCGIQRCGVANGRWEADVATGTVISSACVSVRCSRSASSSPTRPRKAFLGGNEIHGTLSRALAELGGQSSGSLGLYDSSNGLAGVAGGGGFLDPSYLGYPDGSWQTLCGPHCRAERQEPEISQHASTAEAHSKPALAALQRRHAALAAARNPGVRAVNDERMSQEPYLGTCRLPQHVAAAAPPQGSGTATPARLRRSRSASVGGA